jgi:hypothetical protein
LGTASYLDKNVANGKTVNISGITLGGTDAGNYTFNTTATTTANVTAKALTIGGITTANKVYDGTNSTTVNSDAATYTGLVPDDAVTVSTTGSFSDQNAATGKTVTLVSSYSGLDIGNYSISNQGTTTANIIPATLTLTANPAIGSQGSLIPALSGTATGFVNGETVAALVGNLSWTTVATPSSIPGKYPIIGGGASSQNYVMEQATNNATSLKLGAAAISPVPPAVPPATPTPPPSLTPDTVAPPPPDSPPSSPDGTPGGAPAGNPNGSPTGTPAGTPDGSSAVTPPVTQMQLVPLGTKASGGETNSNVTAGESNSTTAGAGGAMGGVNGSFISVKTFSDMTVPAGSAFSFTLPADTFKHADASVSVSIQAKTADGGTLPPWLTFDAGTKRFTGTPPQGQPPLMVILVARDASGGEAFTKIQLNVQQSK